jgi:hypothetical protein
MVRQIRWPFNTQSQLKKIYEYILLDSYQNALKVKVEILSSTKKLSTHPECIHLISIKEIMMAVLGLMNCTDIELLIRLLTKKLSL